ncbi:MAG: ABC transporter permease [Pseudobdellovibrionaceae bacterium]
MKNRFAFLYPFCFFIFILVLLQSMDLAGILNASLIPSPQRMLWALTENWSDQIFPALLETSLHALIGLALSFILGTLIASLLSLSRVARETLLPFAIFLQTVPIVAIAPLLVIYFGFGSSTIIAAATFVSLFPILAGTLVGLSSVSTEQRDLFRLLKASRLKTLIYLQIPAAYPSVMLGLKNAAGLSVIGVVSGEFVAGSGLGSLIDSARTQQKIDLVFIALILLALVGLSFSFFIQFMHFAIHRQRPFARDLDLG